MSAKLFSTMLIVLSSLAAIDRASSIEPAAPASSIINFREYTPTFASSGQLAAITLNLCESRVLSASYI